MPSKKKKYNSRFPPARIKKIMQTDDEIGKVAAAVPVLISKCLEMFLASILTHTGEVTKGKRAKTMSTSHLKECIMNVSMFDFLKDVVANVPDMQNDDEPTTSAASEDGKKAIRKRNMSVPKTPKKRQKLGKVQHSASEENEHTESGGDGSGDDSTIDSNNGLGILSSSMSSPPGPSPIKHQITSRTSSPDKPTFHIPLDELMSPQNVPLLNTDRVLQIVTPNSPEDAGTSFSPDAKSEITVEGSTNTDASNGDLSMQNAMDLTVHSSAQRRRSVAGLHATSAANIYKPQKPEYTDLSSNRIKPESAAPTFAPVGLMATPPIPSPLNMSHLYGPPVPVVPPGIPAPGSARDLTTKIPQGGMLSFLYSSYPPEHPSLAPPPPGEHDLKGHFRSGADHHPKSNHTHSPSTPSMLYPYNPVAEHYKRLASSPAAHPYIPHPRLPESSKESPPPPVIPSSNDAGKDEDDDYDA